MSAPTTNPLPEPVPGDFEGITPIKMVLSQIHESGALAWDYRRKSDLIDEFIAAGCRGDFDTELAAELQALAELAEHRTRDMTLDRRNANAFGALKASAAAARSKLGLAEEPAA